VIILAVLGHATTVQAGEADTFYLTSDGVPRASLSETTPAHGDLPNFDPGRDIKPGLLIERSPIGMLEEDEARFQHWQTDLDGYSLSGVPVLVLWAAVAEFDITKTGVYTAYLLDCPEWGYGCQAFAATENVFQADPGETWVETKIRFDEVEYEIEEGRALAVRIVVSWDSDDDLLLAYDRLNFRSRLMFTTPELAPPLEPEPMSEVLAGSTVAETPEVDGEIAADTIPPVDMDAAFSAEAKFSSSPWGWLTILAVSMLLLGSISYALLRRLRNSEEREYRSERRHRTTPLSG
jgi:hypothetical protein